MSQLTAYQKFIQVALKYGFSLFGLPKSGQIIEYQSGDDGHYQKGYPKTGARFTDNLDGTISDLATGLMWPKDANGAGCNNGATLIWGDAIIWAEGLSFAGHGDWRLPNVKELMSIIDYGRYNPAIDPVFTNIRSLLFWSSTTYHNGTTSAFRVSFSTGGVSYTSKSLTGTYVWAVRGGR